MFVEKKLYLPGEMENLWKKPQALTKVSVFGAGWLLSELTVAQGR